MIGDQSSRGCSEMDVDLTLLTERDSMAMKRKKPGKKKKGRHAVLEMASRECAIVNQCVEVSERVRQCW